MSKSKTIYGQAWISGNSLVQEQLLIIPGSSVVSENTVVLIEDIWKNLTEEPGSSNYGYKTNGKKYFYWEVQMTDMEDDTVIKKVKIECPAPKEGLFEEPYDLDKVSGDYAKYWVNKYKIAQENNEASFAIQRKSITFPGTTYVDYRTGELKKREEIKVENNDLGDISNLLGLF